MVLFLLSGGAGSGYITVTATRINANETLNLIVGASTEASSVEKDG